MKIASDESSILWQIKADAVGQIPPHWKIRSVAELIRDGVLDKIQDGNHGESHPVASDYVPVGIPFLMSGNIRNGRVNMSDCKFLALDHARSLRVGHARRGDVLLTHKGNDLGRTAILREADWAVLTPQITYYRIKNLEALLPDFLKCVFESATFQHQFKRDSEQSTRPFVSISNQRNLYLPIPPIEEQRAIARVLGTIQDKIELNRELNETLEAWARTLFKSWFVDFDPVRAKAEGRNPGLPKHIADLFPNSFEDSDTGEIPTGWAVRSLDKIATYLNGLALQRFPPNSNESLPAVKIAQLRAGHSKGADRVGINLPPEYVIEDGDVLFSWSGSLEVEIWCGGRGALNQHLFKVTSLEFPKWFYYLWTRHYLSDFQDTAANKATTMGHIQRQHLTEARALVPPSKLLEAMTQHFAPLINKVIANRIESRTLASLRDTLLPRLITGDLRVDRSESQRN